MPIWKKYCNYKSDYYISDIKLQEVYTVGVTFDEQFFSDHYYKILKKPIQC